MTHAGRDCTHEVVSTRVFAAPREAVWRAHTDPELLARWWGPEGFTSEFHAFEPRPGGAWRFTMRGPDGAEFGMVREFVEVVPPERIVQDHLEPGHRFRMEMTMADEAPGTRLTWVMRFSEADELHQMREFVAAMNEQNFDRLEALLAAGG